MQFTKNAFGFKTLLLCKDSTLVKIHAKKNQTNQMGFLFDYRFQSEFKDQYGGHGTKAG